VTNGGRTRRVIALFAACAVAQSAFMVAAQAATTPPRITSVGAPTVRLNADGTRTVSMPFSADDFSGSGLARVQISFMRSDGSWVNGAGPMVWTSTGQSHVDGVAVGTLSKWTPSDQYRIGEATVWDQQNDYTDYWPGGQSSSAPAGPVADTVDWSAADFSVDNPNQDVDAPHLSSIKLYQDTVVAGSPVVVTYDAADDRSGVSWMGVTYNDPKGHQFGLSASDPLTAPVGPATGLVPLTATGGKYTVAAITVEDNAGNTRIYQSPYGGGATTDGIDPQSVDFTVTPVAEDSTTPTLDSVNVLSAPTLHPGDELAIDYGASDNLSGVGDIDLHYKDPDGIDYDWSQWCGDLSHGPVSLVLPPSAKPGKWKFIEFLVRDHAQNAASYVYDGTVNVFPSGASGPSSHSLDLSQLDFTVTPGTPGPWPVATGSTLGHGCSLDTVVNAGTDALSVPPGAPVTVTSTVSKAGAAVQNPVTATYAQSGAGVRLVGVTTGSSSGRTAVPATVNATTKFFVRFFGSDSAGSAPPAGSASATVHVVNPGEVVAARDTQWRLTAGHAPTFAAATLSTFAAGPSFAVASVANRNFWFAVTTTHRVYVRDDWSSWRALTNDAHACVTVSAVTVGQSVAIVCDGTDHHLRTATWPASAVGLPSVRTWTDRGVHPGTGATAWSDGSTVRVAVNGSSGVLWRTLTGAWHDAGIRCAGLPSVALSAGHTYLACTGSTGKLSVFWLRSSGWRRALSGVALRGSAALVARPDGMVALWVVGLDERLHRLTLTWTGIRGGWQAVGGRFASGTAAAYGYV